MNCPSGPWLQEGVSRCPTIHQVEPSVVYVNQLSVSAPLYVCLSVCLLASSPSSPITQDCDTSQTIDKLIRRDLQQVRISISSMFWEVWPWLCASLQWTENR